MAQFGRFLLGRVLSQGATGTVYAATDTAGGRPVALLLPALPPAESPAQSRDLADRFAHEARAVAQLSHPSILAPSEFGFADDGQPYLVLARWEGETLRARVQRGGPLLMSEALPLLTQIADALQYAHGRGIIHRDVKPDNVFLCADGTAKLMGFESARLYAEGGAAGAVVGSPAYLSPEQIGGAAPDGRSDVFALAVTAVEALTGRRPFDAPDIPSVMQQILHKPPQLAGVGSRPLRRALEQALAKNPAARTPSAGAFAGALRQAAPPFAFAPPTDEATSLTSLAPLPAAPPTTGREVRWGLAAAVALAALLFLALPLALRRPADTTAGARTPHTISRIASAGPGAPARPGSPAAAAGTDNGEGWIVETTPLPARPKPAPSARAVLQELRDEASAPIPNPRPFRTFPTAAPVASVPPAAYDAPSPAPAVVVPYKKPAGMAPAETIPADAALYGMGAATQLQAPHLIRHTDPVAPPDAPRAAGTARLLVSVNPEGGVSDARVTQSSGDAGLDDAAIASVLQWQYAPATHGGRPVAANVAETVTFGPR